MLEKVFKLHTTKIDVPVLLVCDTASVFNGSVTCQDKGILSYTSNKNLKNLKKILCIHKELPTID